MILKSFEDLKNIIEQQKKDGKKIVSTNGCFDVLHRGHVAYLQEAKNMGDILVVGLNSDKSVKRIKGESRPINDQESRAFVVDALKSVDFVVVFNEETPIEMLKIIKPKYHVKGGDYSGKIIESEIVESGGGEIVFVNFIDGFSSTKIINKLNEV